MPSLGPPELLIILAIVLIFFGVGKLPEVGSALGRGIREFKRASSGADEERAEPTDTETPAQTKAS